MATDCMICRGGGDGFIMCGNSREPCRRTKPIWGRDRETDQLGVPMKPCEGDLPRLFVTYPMSSWPSNDLYEAPGRYMEYL
jgi:hypothetical protein